MTSNSDIKYNEENKTEQDLNILLALIPRAEMYTKII